MRCPRCVAGVSTSHSYGIVSRFSTLIKLKKPSVLQRAGATTARELYDSHLRAKSKSTPTLGTARSIRGSKPLPPGHFLAGTDKSSRYGEKPAAACGQPTNAFSQTHHAARTSFLHSHLCVIRKP